MGHRRFSGGLELNLHHSIEEQGFAVIPEVLRPDDLAELISDLRRSDWPRSRAGIRHAMKLPSVTRTAHDRRVLGIARLALGEEAFPFRATVFDKSPTANWLVVWHQDTALPLKNRRERAGWGPWSMKEGVTYAPAPTAALSQALALRLHLDDSGSANGPLRVLPGTHILGLLTDDQLHDLPTRIPAVECLCPAGGILAMRPLLVHASSKSLSPSPRRVLHIEYAVDRNIAEDLELQIA